MTFITAGMGGGTGTGAAPIIAQTAREEGILTVGVVTKPFQFEGNRRMALAEEGIKELSQYVDTLIIIPNQNLFRIANERTTFADAFVMADEVLHSGVRGITDLMVLPGLVNLDFADVRTVMSEMGKAMMGTGEAEGENRALEAAEAAISNPLLDEVSMKGANGVLINITGGMDLTLFEVDEAANRIRSEINADANILVGSALNPELDGTMRVSVVATGIDSDGQPRREEPKRTYSFETKSDDHSPEQAHEKTGQPVAEQEASSESVNDEDVADVEHDILDQDILELENEAENITQTVKDNIATETNKILAQLSDGIVQEPVKEEAPAADLTAEREEPFISSAPVMPEKRMEPLISNADAFAEAAMVNGPIVKKKPEKRRLLGLFGRRRNSASKGQASSRQTDLLNPERDENIAPIQENVQENISSKPKKSLFDDDLVVSENPATKTDDDHLEIPAFLRRQAN